MAKGAHDRMPGSSVSPQLRSCCAVTMNAGGCAWHPSGSGHLFPRLPSQSEYNRHLRALGPLMRAIALGLARLTRPGTTSSG